MTNVTAEPDFGLAIINSVIEHDFERLRVYVHQNVQDSDDLALLDASVLEVTATLARRAQKFANIDSLSQKTWGSVIGKSRTIPKGIPVNPEWLRADIDTFISDVLSPYINSGLYELDVPTESDERGTPYDEMLIHAYAVALSGAAFVKGVSSTISSYGSPSDILSRLHEYFELMRARGEEYATVELVTEDER